MNLQADRARFADGGYCRAAGARAIPDASGETIANSIQRCSRVALGVNTLGDTNPVTALGTAVRPTCGPSLNLPAADFQKCSATYPCQRQDGDPPMDRLRAWRLVGGAF